MADPKNKWDQPAAPPAPMFFGKKERDLVKQVNDELSERVIGQPLAYYPMKILILMKHMEKPLKRFRFLQCACMHMSRLKVTKPMKYMAMNIKLN